MKKLLIALTLVLSLSVSAAAQNDANQTGTLTAPAQTVVLDLNRFGTATVQITGTWVGTIEFEATVNGTTFVSMPAIRVSDRTVVSNTTANGVFVIAISGFSTVRARASALASGSAAIAIMANGTSTSLPVAGGASANVAVTNAAGAAAVNIQDGGNSITVDGTVGVSGSVAVTGPLTDAQLRATPVPVSGTVATGALTDAQLRATPVPVSGTVTTGGLTDAQLRASAVAVDGSGATQPISAAALPLPAGAATSANQTNASQKTQIVDSGGAVVNATGTSLDVNCTGGCGSTPSFLDNATFTVGSDAIANIGGARLDAPTDVADGSAAAARITPKRGLHVNLRDNNGNELSPLTDAELRATAVTISATSLPLPTGASTAANQTNGSQLSRITDGTDTVDVIPGSTFPNITAPALPVELRSSVTGGDSITGDRSRGFPMFVRSTAIQWQAPIMSADNSLTNGDNRSAYNRLFVEPLESIMSSNAVMGALNAFADSFVTAESASGVIINIVNTSSFVGTIKPYSLNFTGGEVETIAFDEQGNRVTSLTFGHYYYVPAARMYVVRLRVSAYTSGSATAYMTPTVHTMASFSASHVTNLPVSVDNAAPPTTNLVTVGGVNSSGNAEVQFYREEGIAARADSDTGLVVKPVQAVSQVTGTLNALLSAHAVSGIRYSSASALITMGTGGAFVGTVEPFIIDAVGASFPTFVFECATGAKTTTLIEGGCYYANIPATQNLNIVSTAWTSGSVAVKTSVSPSISGFTSAVVQGTVDITGPVAVHGDSLQGDPPNPTDNVVIVGGVQGGGTTRRLVMTASGAVTVDGSATTQPVSGPLTDVELRASPVSVTGTLTDTELRATPVDVLGPLTNTELRASPIDVSQSTKEGVTAAFADPLAVIGGVDLFGIYRTVGAINVAPGGSEQALVVRNIPSGSQNVTGPLTDTELRASSVSMRGDQSAADPTTNDSVLVVGGTQESSTTVRRLEFVAGAGLKVTSTNGLTDTQLRATPVAVSGPLTDAELRASEIGIVGTVGATILNGPLASAVSIQDGGNSITVDGAVTVSGTVTASDPSFTDATGSTVPANAAFVAGTDGTNTRALKTDASGELQIDVLTLPSNASVNVAQVNGATVNVGTGAAGTGTARVTTSTDSTIGTVASVTSLAQFPASAALADSSANPTTTGIQTYPMVFAAGGAVWNRISSASDVVFGSTIGATFGASGLMGIFDNVAPYATTENQFGAIRMSANRNLYGTIRDAAGNERGVNVTAGNALQVDGSASVQPVSDNGGSLTVDAPVATPLFTRLSDGAAALIGQKTMAASLPVVLASDQSAVTVAQATAANLNATVVQATGTNLHVVTDATSTTAVTQATATNLKAQAEVYQGGVAVGAAAPLQVSLANTGANATAVKTDSSATTQPVSIAASVTVAQATGTNLHAVIDTGSTTAATQATASNLNAQVQGAGASGAAKAGKPVQVGGVFNTTQPTVTDGQTVELQSTARGAAIVSTGLDTFNVTVNAAIAAGNNNIGDVDIASFPDNEPFNVAQIAGTATAVNNGAVSNGVQRVTIANDSTGVLAAVTNVATIGTSVTPGTGAANLGKAEDAAAGAGDTLVGVAYQRRDTASVLTSADGEYSTPTVDAYGSVRTTNDHVNRVKCYISSTATTSTIVTGCAAPGAGLSLYVTSVQWYSSIISTTANFMRLQSGTGGTCGTATVVLYDGYASVAFGGNNVVFGTPLKLTANHELCFVHASAGTRLVSVQGFIAP